MPDSVDTCTHHQNPQNTCMWTAMSLIHWPPSRDDLIFTIRWTPLGIPPCAPGSDLSQAWSLPLAAGTLTPLMPPAAASLAQRAASLGDVGILSALMSSVEASSILRSAVKGPPSGLKYERNHGSAGNESQKLAFGSASLQGKHPRRLSQLALCT